ncbi:MAG: MarR family winged helix-turn-helix transcriptional regulator [Sutterella wadsworthensis]|jgi:DNA-binding MarR family transcriptional regulator|uniref:MarR family winged helix-turn-helix transcriptional regulator n=1 Tax=Sutterella sp. KLE1602 TaxID=1574262 RepID=UPI000782A7F5|nr:MarR family transcriptional regulator [Sutterella sp. KLE1602]KXT33675.1 transcriptional regulator, MarR family [Sutterella sp. KLE1602]MBS6615368.1 MarR family transcriptional regulator [Sutterella wadsworthensis]MEE0160694.1 MarR family transcriptional regulator [Sutterella wadsworthensis]
MKENTRIPFLAGRLSEATSTFILESLKREGMGELLPCHGDILHVLTEQETATVMELSRLTHRSKSTVSALVTKLVDLGYVARERSAEDSRVINLRLTEKGRAFIPVSKRISSELDALVTRSLTPDEARFAEALLARILNGFSSDKSA